MFICTISSSWSNLVVLSLFFSGFLSLSLSLYLVSDCVSLEGKWQEYLWISFMEIAFELWYFVGFVMLLVE